MQVIRWVRSAGNNAAERTDGYSIQLRGTHWTVSKGGRTKVLPTEPYPAYMDKAIATVDGYFPPSRWAWKEDRWISGNWIVVQDGGKWGVRRLNAAGELDYPTRQEFLTADRARVWAELRRDRTSIGLRGPKPRNGVRATSKLPDIRVSTEERDEALYMLTGLNLTYAGFVRAALAWVEQYIVPDDAAWTVDTLPNGEPVFVPREAVALPEETESDEAGADAAWAALREAD
jgi:hypothetical protein